MESLKKVIAQVVSQMRGMGLSQRLVLLLGAVLVAGSVIWMGQWAAQPEMVPLLAQDLETSELASVQTGLETLGEKFSVIGSRIFVSAGADRQSILARLQQDNKLPADTSIGFAALVQESNPWISQEENQRRWTVALQSELVRVLETFDGVKSASVFLNINSKRTLVSRNPVASTASVTLTMEGGEAVSRQLAMSVARMVAGAISGLKPADVAVVDSAGRRPWVPEEEADGSASQLYRDQLQRERTIATQIRAQLPDPNARVAVRVGLNHTARRMTSDEPVEGVATEIETTSDTVTSGYAAQEPGVRPNTGTGMVGGGAMNQNSEQETSRTKLVPGRITKEESTPSGDIEEIFASIYLSDLYLTTIYRKANPEAAEPTPEQLGEIFDQQEPRVRRQVRMLVTGQGENVEDENIAVDWYYQVPDMVPVVAAGALDEAVGWAKRYGPQSGLALLALASLGLMLRMARRGDVGAGESFGLEIGLPQDAIEAAQRAADDVQNVAESVSRRPPGQKGGGTGPMSSALAGAPQSEAGEGLLVAKEVDESTVQTQKMVEHVAKFVEKDAETVANLIERWVRSDD
ncbi:MAG: hypothetical protein JXO22_04305 [Phycisphaerae bacterium]|nr:hypothetical protein [Phycisphaerae bacterium]